MTLTLDKAQKIVARALERGRELDLKPLCVAVLDARGAMKAFAAEDDTSLRRGEIAHGKAYGSLALGLGSRAIHRRAEEQSYFIASVTHAAGGALVPVPGGVLIRNTAGELVGAVGVSGDVSDNDEAVALAGIEAAGFTGDTGG